MVYFAKGDEIGVVVCIVVLHENALVLQTDDSDIVI